MLPLARLGLLAGCLTAHLAQAQDGVAGKAVRLQLRPHAGDTLRVRLDQTIESSQSRRPEPNDDLDKPGDVASLTLLARMVVEGVDAAGSVALALIDSVRVTAAGALDGSPTLRSARALQGQRFRFRIRPDGSTVMTGPDAWLDPGVRNLFLQLPATLPVEPVAPGASWARAVELPLSGVPEAKTTATLNATFHFDSLSGDYAYLSVRGRLVRSGPSGSGTGNNRNGFVQTAGEVTGKILIDLRRGWIADARSAVTLQSLITTGDRSPTARVRVRITQWMRVM